MAGTKMDDNLLVTKAMKLRLYVEAEADGDMPPCDPPLWHCLMQRSNGEIVEFESHHATSGNLVFERPTPPADQRRWGEAVVRILNKACHFDGSWCVEFTHNPEFYALLGVGACMDWRRAVLMFLDRDGDVQFSVEILEPFTALVQVEPEHWVEQAVLAYQEYDKLMHKTLKAENGQKLTYKAAQGEAAPSAKN